MPAFSSSHKESLSKDYFRSCISSFRDENWHEGAPGDAIVRDITERDLGVDCVLEILDWEKPTGMLALIQLKSTEKEIKELSKTKGLISCPNVSKSNLHYCQQNRIPMILVYAHVDVETNRCDRFYFTDIREEGLRLLGAKEQDYYTLHIPINNCNLTRMRFLFELIEQNYR